MTVAPPEGAGFVDLHTHLVPSGDDGVETTLEALELCRLAVEHGTSMLYVTPHVNLELPLTPERDAAVRTGARRVGNLLRDLEIRVGYELDPRVDLTSVEQIRAYRLDGYAAVLVECPLRDDGFSSIDLLVSAAEQVQAAGSQVVLAHPERSPTVWAHPELVEQARRRRWLLQITAASLFGRHGRRAAEVAWSLLERGNAQIVASDAHRRHRPPPLDEAFSAISARLGKKEAFALLNASALGTAAQAG